MAHIPHLLVDLTISSRDTIAISDDQVRHLTRVIRYRPGQPVSYTDGSGTLGTGTWNGESLERGDESLVERGRSVTLAVAPPKAKERQRFIVEKAAELGVDRLMWIQTRYGQVPAPSLAKATSWAIGALEQSRRAHLLRISSGSLADIEGVVVADQSGSMLRSWVPAIAIGPEGGWHPDEIEGLPTARLSDAVLRTETAAVVAAAFLASPVLT